MNWLRRLQLLVIAFLSAPDPYRELEEAGFQRVFVMGEDGQHRVVPDLVGWWVPEEARCWRFKARVYDPETWPRGLKDALFLTVSAPGELLQQIVVTTTDECWLGGNTLVLHPCTKDQILAHLVDDPDTWEVVAQRLGLGTIRWRVG